MWLCIKIKIADFLYSVLISESCLQILLEHKMLDINELKELLTVKCPYSIVLTDTRQVIQKLRGTWGEAL